MSTEAIRNEARENVYALANAIRMLDEVNYAPEAIRAELQTAEKQALIAMAENLKLLMPPARCSGGVGGGVTGD